MSDDIEQVMERLDQNKPNWELDWATAQDAGAFVGDVGYIPIDVLRKQLRWAAKARIHHILNAALDAGIVNLPNAEKPLF